MSNRYVEGPLILRGGTQPQRKVFCPQHGVELLGWEDLKGCSVFFDVMEAEYVVWADDPSLSQDLQLPPKGERVEVTLDGTGTGQARFRFDQAEIIVEGRVVRRDDVLLKRIVELPSGAVAKALPLNGEEAICVDWQQGGISDDEHEKGFWEVHLRGGWRPFIWRVEAIRDVDVSEPANVTLLLWPGFDDPDWNSDIVVYVLRKMRNLVPPRVRCYGKGPRTQSLLGEHDGRDITCGMLRLSEKVEALEFRSPGGEPLGYMRPMRRTLHPGPGAKAIVSLDFGTRNTTVCSKMPNALPRVITMNEDAPLELLASVDPAEQQRIAEILNLLPFWPKLPPQHRIPSELLFFPESCNWTIPRRGYEPRLFDSMDVRRDFKWFDEGNLHRLIYLGFVLRMALANLRTQGVTSIALRATVPPLFERRDLCSYQEVIQALGLKLTSETGMQIEIDGYETEAAAGIWACGQGSGNLQCAIDMNEGGTCTIVRTVDSNHRFRQPFIVDWLRVGSNDVMDSLVGDSRLIQELLRQREVPNKGPGRAKEMARQIVVREALESNALPGWWRAFVAGNAQAQLFLERERALFDGILAYALRLASVAEQDMRRDGRVRKGEECRIDVFLLGSGWNLLRLASEGRNPQAYVQERLREFQVALPFVPDYKFGVYAPDASEFASGLGAALLPSVESVEKLENSLGLRAVFGIDIEFYEGFRLEAEEFLDDLRSRPAIKSCISRTSVWDQFIEPLLQLPGMTDYVRQLFGSTGEERRGLFENGLADRIDKYMAEDLSKGLAPRVSPLGLLEEIWVDQLALRRAPGAN
jgi:hypothetical protein